MQSSIGLPMRYTKKRNNLIRQGYGFTLIEMLIVSAMLSIVSLAVYSTFNNGIKIWQKVNSSLPEEDLNIFFDKFSRDLSNTFKFTGMPFIGKDDRTEFPAFIHSPRFGNKATVGKVIYSFDSSNEKLKREQRDLSGVYNDEKGIAEEPLKNIRALKLQYYFYDEQKKEYYWLDEWQGSSLPLSVRIQLSLDNGGTTRNFTKTVSIPASG